MMRAIIFAEKDAARRVRSSFHGLLRFVSAGCLVVIILGCTDTEPGGLVEVQRNDSAGVEVVVVPGQVLDHLPVWSLAPDPVLSVAGEQLEGFPLSRIAGAVILSNRKVAIADQILDQVIVVGFSGTVLHRFGQRGNGPGEISDVSGLRRRADDELVIWDHARGQLVVYDTAGTFREVVQTPQDRTAQRFLDFPGFLVDGSPVFERRGLPSSEMFEGARRPEFVVDRYHPDGAFDSALASIPGNEVVGFRSDRGGLTVSARLKGRAHLTVGRGRAYLGHGERFEIQTWSAEGLERITRVQRARRVASRSEREAIRDSVLASLARSPFGNRHDIGRSDIPVGDSFPAFEDLRADVEGGVWMKESWDVQDAPSSWVIFDRTGEPTARIRTPDGFDLVDVRGDLVLGVSTDEFVVPTVVLYRIEEGASEVPGTTGADVGIDARGAAILTGCTHLNERVQLSRRQG